MEVYLHQREATPTVPAGTTVTKSKTLPEGDFRITEYIWPWVTLWFMDNDEFTADEREAVAVSVREVP